MGAQRFNTDGAVPAWQTIVRDRLGKMMQSHFASTQRKLNTPRQLTGGQLWRTGVYDLT